MLKALLISILSTGLGTPTGLNTVIGVEKEATIIELVGHEYQLDDQSIVLMAAIRREENGATGKEMGVDSIPQAMRYPHSPVRSMIVQCRWTAGTVRKHYAGDLDTFARRWCIANWQSWRDNVRELMEGGTK